MNSKLIKQLSDVGITELKEVIHNPSYEALYLEEKDKSLAGFEKVQDTEFGAVNVMTGVYTGRSPKDKYILKDETTKDKLWWANEQSKNDNKPIDIDVWNHLKSKVTNQLSNKKIYVVDAYCGANEDTCLKVRFVMEVAWQAHFVKNMFIRPSDEELLEFVPDFYVLNGSKVSNTDFKKNNLNSETFIAFNLTDKIQIIGGTWYGGEMKKGMFSVMNYLLPQQNIASMHCSANRGLDGSVALFFGLSGTGKTTLSADPTRNLIGDDEHGWDGDTVFNFEGGCYAKCIDLSQEKEPDIYSAIKEGALLENVSFFKGTNIVNFKDTSITENTRVSYPIEHINNIAIPSYGKNPKNIFFLTADAFGVLPPVSKLTKGQAMYHFISGYTAKVAGTEAGITEPQTTFSACFGAPFMPLHPTKYAEMLGEKITSHNVNVWLINTGWSGGEYGVGERISLKYTRAMITAILNNELENIEYINHQVFGLSMPLSCPNVPDEILSPINTWGSQQEYLDKANELADAFNKNFKQFAENANDEILTAAPKRYQ